MVLTTHYLIKQHFQLSELISPQGMIQSTVNIIPIQLTFRSITRHGVMFELQRFINLIGGPIVLICSTFKWMTRSSAYNNLSVQIWPKARQAIGDGFAS